MKRIFISKEDDNIVSPYSIFLVHINSVLDSLVLLNSMNKEITDLKDLRTARSLISYLFGVGLEDLIQSKFLNTLSSHVLDHMFFS